MFDSVRTYDARKISSRNFQSEFGHTIYRPGPRKAYHSSCCVLTYAAFHGLDRAPDYKSFTERKPSNFPQQTD
jgi:hypothetical protein